MLRMWREVLITLSWSSHCSEY